MRSRIPRDRWRHRPVRQIRDTRRLRLPSLGPCVLVGVRHRERGVSKLARGRGFEKRRSRSQSVRFYLARCHVLVLLHCCIQNAPSPAAQPLEGQLPSLSALLIYCGYVYPRSSLPLGRVWDKYGTTSACHFVHYFSNRCGQLIFESQSGLHNFRVRTCKATPLPPRRINQEVQIHVRHAHDQVSRSFCEAQQQRSQIGYERSTRYQVQGTKSIISNWATGREKEKKSAPLPQLSV